MSNSVDLTLGLASAEDLDEVLPVVREFYAHFEFPWDEVRKRGLLAGFLANPGSGRLWLARSGGRIVGYALVAFYFSLEFDGRVALLDEFYLTAETRGRGLGGRFLDQVSGALAADGIGVLRLEVEARHPEAARLYARQGFKADGRGTWSRMLR